MLNYEDLTPEQIAKVKTCNTAEELLALAKSEGYELSDEELELVAGGKWGEGEAQNKPQIPDKCPYCGSSNVLVHRY